MAKLKASVGWSNRLANAGAARCVFDEMDLVGRDLMIAYMSMPDPVVPGPDGLLRRLDRHPQVRIEVAEEVAGKRMTPILGVVWVRLRSISMTDAALDMDFGQASSLLEWLSSQPSGGY